MGARPREQDELAASHRLLAIASVAFLAAAGALAFSRVYQGHFTTLKLVAAAVLSVAVAAALERRGPVVAVLGSGVGLLIASTVLVFPKTAAVIFPTPDTFGAIGRALHHVGQQARVQVAPTPPLQPLLLAGVTAVWTAAFAAHALAVRAGSPILAAIPPGSLLAFADILLRDGARPSYAALFLAAALSVLFMDGLRRVRQWGPLRPWPGARGRRRLASTTATRGARRVTAIALGGALIVPGLLPGFQSPAILKIDTSNVLAGPTVNPLVSVTASLKQQQPQDLFLVSADQPAYWRWQALDQFDGTQWTSSDLEVDNGRVIAAGDPLPESRLEGAGINVRQADLFQTVFVLQDTSDPWLPMAFHPLTVEVGRSSIRYDPNSAAAVPEVGVQKGLTYTVRSRLLLPTPRQLNAVTDFSGSAYRRYEELPASTPPQIFAIAQDVSAAASTPFEKLVAIQTFLHTFTYDQRVNGKTDIGSVLNFLTRTKRGFCQQFATAMAVLARALGYPARVAVGFTPGRYDARLKAWRVGTQNAHAWVEVLFPGYGWLAFEPTPTRDNPVADSYLAPNAKQFEPCRVQGTCGNGTSKLGKGGGKVAPGIGAKAAALAAKQHNRFEAGQLGVGGIRFRRGQPQVTHPYRLPLELLGLLLAILLGSFLLLVPLAKVVGRRVRLARAGPPGAVAIAAYRMFTGRAADLGLARRDGETLREYRDRIRMQVHPSGDHLDRLTQIVSRAAYSAVDVTKEQAREATAAGRRAIREVRKAVPFGKRIVGVFRLGM